MDIRSGQYTDVEYWQFQPDRWMQAAGLAAGVLTWPVIWPLALLCLTSDAISRTASELLSLLPYLLGVVVVDFGTVYIFRDISLGDNVLIDRYSIVHHCDLGTYVLTAEG